MKRKQYNVIYGIVLLIIIVVLLAIPNLNDMAQMGLGALAIILTSIFTYSNRHEIPRKKR